MFDIKYTKIEGKMSTQLKLDFILSCEITKIFDNEISMEFIIVLCGLFSLVRVLRENNCTVVCFHSNITVQLFSFSLNFLTRYEYR